MPATGEAGSDQSQGPGHLSGSLIWVAGTQTLGPHSLLPGYIGRELEQQWSSQDSDCHSDMGGQQLSLRHHRGR